MAENGSDIIHPRENGRTTLHLAVYEHHATTAQMLLSLGSDPDTVDDDGNTSLHILCSQNPQEKDVDFALQICNALIAAHAKINLQNKDGATPLHLAMESQAVDLALVLLASGADPLIRDTAGDTTHDLLKVWPTPRITEALNRTINAPPSLEMREVA